jgi:hypothetical protein
MNVKSASTAIQRTFVSRVHRVCGKVTVWGIFRPAEWGVPGLGIFFLALFLTGETADECEE